MTKHFLLACGLTFAGLNTSSAQLRFDKLEFSEEKISSLLLDQLSGYDFWKQDADGNTLLIKLVANYSPSASPLICRLVEKYPKEQSQYLNIANAQGKTALHLACQAQNLPLVKYLLAFGASASLKDKEGKSAKEYLNEQNAALIAQDFETAHTAISQWLLCKEECNPLISMANQNMVRDLVSAAKEGTVPVFRMQGEWEKMMLNTEEVKKACTKPADPDDWESSPKSYPEHMLCLAKIKSTIQAKGASASSLSPQEIDLFAYDEESKEAPVYLFSLSIEDFSNYYAQQSQSLASNLLQYSFANYINQDWYDPFVRKACKQMAMPANCQYPALYIQQIPSTTGNSNAFVNKEIAIVDFASGKQAPALNYADFKQKCTIPFAQSAWALPIPKLFEAGMLTMSLDLPCHQDPSPSAKAFIALAKGFSEENYANMSNLPDLGKIPLAFTSYERYFIKEEDGRTMLGKGKKSIEFAIDQALRAQKIPGFSGTWDFTSKNSKPSSIDLETYTKSFVVPQKASTIIASEGDEESSITLTETYSSKDIEYLDVLWEVQIQADGSLSYKGLYIFLGLPASKNPLLGLEIIPVCLPFESAYAYLDKLGLKSKVKSNTGKKLKLHYLDQLLQRLHPSAIMYTSPVYKPS